MKSRFAAVVLAATLGTTLVACGSDTKTVETKDGKVTVSGNGKDGTVTIKGKGKDDTSFSIKQGEVPAGFPSEVPLPKGLKLKAGTKGQQGAKQFFTLSYELESKSPATALAAYGTQLKDDGFEVPNLAGLTGASGSFLSLEAKGKGWTVIASSLGAAGGAAVMSVIVSSAT